MQVSFFQHQFRLMLVGPAIHPSIFYCFFGVWLRGQQTKQESPDFPFPSYFVQLFQRLSQASWDTCPRSSKGPPTRGTCPEDLPKEAGSSHCGGAALLQNSPEWQSFWPYLSGTATSYPTEKPFRLTTTGRCTDSPVDFPLLMLVIFPNKNWSNKANYTDFKGPWQKLLKFRSERRVCAVSEHKAGGWDQS